MFCGSNNNTYDIIMSSKSNKYSETIKLNKISKNNTFNSNYVPMNDLSINNVLESKIHNKFVNNENEIDKTSSSNDYFELEKLEKEFVVKSNINSIIKPKNHGNFWTGEEKTKILKYLSKNNYGYNFGLFDETNIEEIAKKLERTEYAVREEIKKMIFNDYIDGLNYSELSSRYNIPEPNIRLIIKSYIDKYGKKIMNSINNENLILKLHIENIKLKTELKELKKSK